MLRRQRNLTSNRGFTLVEIAISLVILGMLIARLFVLYDQYRQ